MSLRDLRTDSTAWKILEERARALAQHQADTTIEQGEEVLDFRLGDDVYSLPAQFIREVHPLESWTRLPTTPAFVVGLVNVRGKILAALDIRPLLDIAPGDPKEGAFLVIINVHGTEVGLLADSVTEVRRGDSELTPTLSAVAGRSIPWVLGLDQHLSLLLDPPRLLADPRIVIHDETA